MSKLCIRQAIVAVMLLVSTGCVIRHGDFTVLSNKLVRLSNFELSKADRERGVEGRDVAHIICIIPTKMQITLDAAIDDALSKGDGDVLTDAVVHQWGWYIPYIYGQFGWSIVGDVVKTRRN